tara:strand:- start:705 stop:1208 length:504 start_codon:yes stop_codon:yes gene_type:complete
MENENKKIDQLFSSLGLLFMLAIVFVILIPGVFLYFQYVAPANEAKLTKLKDAEQAWAMNKDKVLAKEAEEKVEDGIHLSTGLIADADYKLVIQNCTACHSAKLITQNRADKDGWLTMIRWMQAEQKLWDLGENEDKILEYLAKNYAPQEKGRRTPLKDVDWYVLED